MTLATLGLGALLTAGVLSWFASTRPDGLEWSVARTAISQLRTPASGTRAAFARLQQTLAPWPGYDRPAPPASAEPTVPPWPAVHGAASLAGVVGSALTMALVMLVGFALRRRAARAASER